MAIKHMAFTCQNFSSFYASMSRKLTILRISQWKNSQPVSHCQYAARSDYYEGARFCHQPCFHAPINLCNWHSQLSPRHDSTTWACACACELGFIRTTIRSLKQNPYCMSSWCTIYSSHSKRYTTQNACKPGCPVFVFLQVDMAFLLSLEPSIHRLKE